MNNKQSKRTLTIEESRELVKALNEGRSVAGLITKIPERVQDILRKKSGKKPKKNKTRRPSEIIAEAKQTAYRDRWRKRAMRDGWGDIEFEYAFTNERQWRFDIALTSYKVAIEVEGGVWSNGRHVRGTGFIKDMEKYNTAAVDGWFVLRVLPDKQFDASFTKTINNIIRRLRNGNFPRYTMVQRYFSTWRGNNTERRPVIVQR